MTLPPPTSPYWARLVLRLDRPKCTWRQHLAQRLRRIANRIDGRSGPTIDWSKFPRVKCRDTRAECEALALRALTWAAVQTEIAEQHEATLDRYYDSQPKPRRCPPLD